VLVKRKVDAGTNITKTVQIVRNRGNLHDGGPRFNAVSVWNNTEAQGVSCLWGKAIRMELRETRKRNEPEAEMFEREDIAAKQIRNT
jgi:hypothetical protein